MGRYKFQYPNHKLYLVSLGIFQDYPEQGEGQTNSNSEILINKIKFLFVILVLYIACDLFIVICNFLLLLSTFYI